MTYEEFNEFCRSLIGTNYVTQWGNSHVWKVAEKVFAIGGWEKSNSPAFTFKTSEQNYDVLKEESGFRPAPYMASRGMKWIQQYQSLKETDEEIKHYLEESH